MIRTLIVDDEELGRLRVQQLLEHQPDFEVVGVCSGGADAVQWLQNAQCDLLFLDIQMPETDGFAVIRETPQARLPVVVFITAYHEYAIEAFRVHALDYLLKPVDREQFQDTLIRVKDTLTSQQQQGYLERLSNMLQEQNQQTRFKQKFVTIKQGERMFPVQYQDIIAVEAQGNYLLVHTTAQQYRMRSTLTDFLTQASHQPMQQINRSVAINMEAIKEIQRYFKGEFALVMKNDLEFITSAKYRSNIQSLMD